MTTDTTASPSATPIPRARGRLAFAAAIGVAAGAAIGALAFGGVALTNAFFTSQATVTGQSVGTATVRIEAGVASTSAPIAATDLLPGDSVSTTILVENTGTVALDYEIAVTSLTGDEVLQDALDVTIAPVGAGIVAQPLSAWATDAYEGLSLDAGETVNVVVTVSLPETSAAQNGLQTKTAGFSLRFDAIQQ